MTDPVPPDSQSRPHTDPLDQVFGAMRGLGVFRDPSGRWFSGVCSGLALRLGVDPLIVRAGFILGTCMFGIAVPLYILAWALLPDAEGHILLERAVRENHGPSVTTCVILGVVLLNSIWIFWSWGSWGFGIGPLIVAGLIIWAIASGRVRGADLKDPGDLARRMREGMDRQDWVGRMREGWAAGSSSGNRAAQAGAQHRSGIDLTKHDEHPSTDPFATQPFPPRPRPWSGTPRPWTTPVVPARPRRRTLGALTLVVLGVALLAGAGTAMALEGTAYANDSLQVGLAAATAVCGLGLLVAGLFGAKGGFLTGVSIPLALVTVLSLLVPTGMPWSGGIGTRTWAPSAVSGDHRQTFALVTGDGTLDLTRLHPGDVTDSQPLTTRVNIGTLRVEVPENLTVRFHTQVDLGGIQAPQSVWRQTSDGSPPAGSGIRRDFTVGSGKPDLVVDARVGVGQLIIDREPSTIPEGAGR